MRSLCKIVVSGCSGNLAWWIVKDLSVGLLGGVVVCLVMLSLRPWTVRQPYCGFHVLGRASSFVTGSHSASLLVLFHGVARVLWLGMLCSSFLELVLAPLPALLLLLATNIGSSVPCN
jgi:hypothetical protein